MTAPSSDRHTLIDALRGFALLGILAVNIQGFVWAVGGPSLGVLWEDGSRQDTVTVFLTALLLEFKFYPLFCFCFGYGFALMARRWRRAGVDVSARFGRRLRFMLGLGLLHGLLIWFGDILSRYAITAFILRRHLGKGPRALLQPLTFWLTVSVVLLAAGVFGIALAVSPGVSDNAEQSEMLRAYRLYAEAGYFAQTPQRVEDFLFVLASWILNVPQAMVLFLCGAIVAPLGWLRNPMRHRALWWRILTWSVVIGVPINVVQAFSAVEVSINPTLPPGVIEMICSAAAPLLAPAYMAALALASLTPLGKTLVELLAPAGRMALTNYLLQSVLMGALLLGYGAGLADQGQANLFLIALAIYGAQLAFSHWYLAHYAQGPMEMLWRRHTNAT